MAAVENQVGGGGRVCGVWVDEGAWGSMGGGGRSVRMCGWRGWGVHFKTHLLHFVT